MTYSKRVRGNSLGTQQALLRLVEMVNGDVENVAPEMLIRSGDLDTEEVDAVGGGAVIYKDRLRRRTEVAIKRFTRTSSVSEKDGRHTLKVLLTSDIQYLVVRGLKQHTSETHILTFSYQNNDGKHD